MAIMPLPSPSISPRTLRSTATPDAPISPHQAAPILRLRSPSYRTSSVNSTAQASVQRPEVLSQGLWPPTGEYLPAGARTCPGKAALSLKRPGPYHILFSPLEPAATFQEPGGSFTLPCQAATQPPRRGCPRLT